MKNYYNIMALLFTVYASAQAPTIDWTYSLPDKIDRSSPAIADDGTVYIGCSLGTRTAVVSPTLPNPNFFAVNSDGTLKWQTSISEGNFLKPDAIVSSASINSDGSIYMGGRYGRIVFRLNAVTGDTIRTKHINTRQRYTAPVFADNGDVYICGHSKGDKGIRSLSPDLITENWIFGAGNDFNSTAALAADGTIYAASTNGSIYAINSDGTEKWNAVYGNYVSSAIAIGTDGSVYLSAKLNSDADGVLKSYDPADGSENWSVTLTGANAEQGGPAIADDGTIYLGNKGGRIKAYSPTDGSELWSYPLAANPAIAGIEVVPAIDNDGNIYFGTTDGMFYVLDDTGVEEYTPLDLGDRVDSSVAIAADGTVYVGVTDAGVGKLYALSTTATGLASGDWPMYGRTSKHTANVDMITLSTTALKTTSEFIVFPNPVTSGEFQINTTTNGSKSLEIYDLQGKEVYSKLVSADEIVKVSNLNPGIYILKVIEGNLTATQKLIIE